MKYLNCFVTLARFLGGTVCRADYHTNPITTPDDMYAFRVDGGTDDNPTLDLKAGVTNILDIQTYDDHPVIITTTSFLNYDGAFPRLT